MISHRHLGLGFGRAMSFLGNGMRRGAHSVIDRPRKLAHRKRVQPRESAPEEVVAEQVPEALTQSRHPLQRYAAGTRYTKS